MDSNQLFKPTQGTKLGLILLNYEFNPILLEHFWSKCAWKICADGAGNRLYKMDREKRPDCIVGDLDSLKPSVRRYYEVRGSEIVVRKDQNDHDFTKACRLLSEKVGSRSLDYTVVLGGLGGRLDHFFTYPSS